MNEEDIKILENYKEMNLDDFNYNERQVKQAIENLINRNKELEEENSKLKRQIPIKFKPSIKETNSDIDWYSPYKKH